MEIDLMNKEELREHAKTLGISLDMRKSIENLREDVKAKPVIEKKEKVVKAYFLLNEKTGFWFPWTKLLEDRGDLVPCDEDGNRI